MQRSLDLRRGLPRGQGSPVGCDRFASFVGLMIMVGQAGLVGYGFAVATGAVARPQWPVAPVPSAPPPLLASADPRPAEIRQRPSPAAVAAPRPVPAALDAMPMAVSVPCSDLRPLAREIQRRFGRGVTVRSEGPPEKPAEVGCGGYAVRVGRRSREVARYLAQKTQVQVRKDADGIFHVSPVKGREALASVPGLEP